MCPAGLLTMCVDGSLQRLADAERDTKIIAVALCTFLHGLIGTNRKGYALTPWAAAGSQLSVARAVNFARSF